MTSPSPSPASWVRRRGATVAVALFAVLVAALTVRCRSDAPPAARHAAAGALGEPDDWMSKWHKETFDGQDSRKLWEQFSQAAKAELSKPGADPSDLTAKANALGADPEKVFEFIRDQITLEPYAGVLRGARGTLAAGAGNALDRVLLAKDLLRLNGIDSRIVRGRLSDAQTDTLLSRFFSSHQLPTALADLIVTPDNDATKEDAVKVAATFGVAEKAALSLAAHMRAEAQGFWARTDAQSSIQFDSLDSQLHRTTLKMAVDAGAITAALKARLRDHYWLQVREPSGTWSDFDAAFADNQRGTAHASQAAKLSDPPDSLYHRLTFSLIYQTTADDGPKEDTVVSGTYVSADALFQSMAFEIRPTDLGDASALSAMDAKARAASFSGAKRFQGLLRAGGTVTAGRKFDFEGNTYDPSSGPLLQPAGGTFADALGGGGENAVRFVELRVVMRVTGPGREPMIQSRTLVRGSDLASGIFTPPILQWEILFQPQWISDDFVAFRTLDQIVGMGDALIRAARGDRSPANVRSRTSASPLALQMAVLRETAVARILAAESGVRALIEAPMLTIVGNQIAGVDDKTGALAAARSFDIVDNGVRYVPISDSATTRAFDAALRQGVADCTLEDRILSESFPGTTDKSGLTIVEQAKLEKRPVLLAKTQDIDALRSTGVTEADIEWIHDNEAPDARLVVATTANGSDAWWSVRPNGTTILRTNGGRGQAKVEYILPLVDDVMTELCVFEVASAAYQQAHEGRIDAGTGVGAFLCVGNMFGARFMVAMMPHHGAGVLLVEGLWIAWDIFTHVFVHEAFE